MNRTDLATLTTAVLDAVAACDLYGLHADDCAANPGPGALRAAKLARDSAVDALVTAHHDLDTDGADDCAILAPLVEALRGAEDVLYACDVALGLGSAAAMAVAS